MRLKLTLTRRAADPVDVLVTVDTTVTVGALAETLARRDPTGADAFVRPTLRLDRDGATAVLDPNTTVSDATVRSGHVVSVVDAAGDRFVESTDHTAAAVLHVIKGPDAGSSFRLRSGSNQVGRERGNDVLLSDPMVSKRHARVNVGEQVEVIDLGSSNGIVVDGELVTRIAVAADDVVVLGDSSIRIERLTGGAAAEVDGAVYFNRSPRLDPVYEGPTFEAPEVPRPQDRARFPMIMLLAPVLLGVALFAVTRQVYTVLFIALSPIMMLGNYLEGRMSGGKAHRATVDRFRRSVVELETSVAREAGTEAAARRAAHPSTEEVFEAARTRGQLLWARRPGERGFLEARVGLADLPSLASMVLPRRGDGHEELWNSLVRLRDRYRAVPSVPVVGALCDCGSIGIAGPRPQATATARAIVVNLAGLHSPAEVVLAAVASPSSSSAWEWLKWLPHVGSDHSPLATDHLAASPSSVARLVAAIDEMIDRRLAIPHGEPVKEPRLVVLVEDDAPIERARLVDIGMRGVQAGVHLLWIAPTVERLPAVCRTFVDHSLDQEGVATVGDVSGAEAVERVRAEQIDIGSALRFARLLSPVIDAGAPIDDESDLPRQISLLALIGTDVASDAGAVIDRWRTSNSLPSSDVLPRRENSLRAVVGATVGQSFVLDLRSHGPHALVGGTTGSGKSEFLQTWVMSMATEHSPGRVTFLFVDYKGGAAFGECVNLPHCVGLVTDLTPHLVNRALTSLNAELRYRESILREKKAKDLLELESRGDVDAPPSLVIVVDEFAALATEVPEFVDGVVNVAQRGRSLGLHLVLATQRPAGVIKDNLRANTNLRIALRVADEDDSHDVVGTAQAATFDVAVPGRALAKTGPGRLTPFQSAYVGGWTSNEPAPPVVEIHELGFGIGVEWVDARVEPSVVAPTGPNDLQRLVRSIVDANAQALGRAPRRPWLPELASVYDLAKLPQSRTDDRLVFGVVDDPGRQAQMPIAFHPDRDGNLGVIGTGGSGKTTVLRTLAVSAGLATRSGPCHVYGIDFAGHGLDVLHHLPHVGSIVSGDDHERLTRLLRWLRGTIDERATRYRQTNSDTITSYRAASGRVEEPRILTLIDGMAAFRTAYESGDRVRWLDVLTSIATDGRQFGVHLVVAADRANAIPSAVASALQRRLVLRLATEQDYALADIADPDVLIGAPAGRGLVDGTEVQVAVLGGSANAQRQGAAIEKLAQVMRENLERAAPVRIGRLTDRVTLGQLPVLVDGQPVLGVADDTLEPIGFSTEDTLLVIGPPASGVTSTLAAMTLSLRRARSVRSFLIANKRSPLWQLPDFEARLSDGDSVAEFARALSRECEDGRIGPDEALVVIDDAQQLIDIGAETAALDLVRTCADHGVLMIVSIESSLAGGYSQLLQSLRAKRHGFALQPEQHEGDQVFKVQFPRIARSEFPPGRGLYVRKGSVVRVQCALPDLEV